MGRKMVAIFTPAALGLLLLGLVFVDLHQFRSGSIDVHVALGRELFVFVVGLMAAAMLFVAGMYWFYKNSGNTAYCRPLVLVFFAAASCLLVRVVGPF